MPVVTPPSPTLAKYRELTESFAPQLQPIQPPQPVDAPAGPAVADAGGGGDNESIFNEIAQKFGLRRTGGDRTPEHNAEVGGVPNSYHLRPGWAQDFVGSAKQMQDALVYARAHYNPVETLVHNAGSGQHFHLVVRPQPYRGGGSVQQVPAYSGGGQRVGQVGGLSPAEAWIIQHESGGNPQAYNKTPVYSGGKLLGNAWGLGQIVDNRPIAQRPQSVQEQLGVFRDYVRKRYGTAEKAQQFWKAHGWYRADPTRRSDIEPGPGPQTRCHRSSRSRDCIGRPEVL